MDEEERKWKSRYWWQIEDYSDHYPLLSNIDLCNNYNLKILSWNTMCTGLRTDLIDNIDDDDNKENIINHVLDFHVRRICEFLEELIRDHDPDVILLQEIYLRSPHFQNNTLDYLREHYPLFAEYNYYDHSNADRRLIIPRRNRSPGTCIFVKTNLTVDTIDYLNTGREDTNQLNLQIPRRPLEIGITINNQRIIIRNIHIFNQNELRYLFSKANNIDILILGGDFNCKPNAIKTSTDIQRNQGLLNGIFTNWNFSRYDVIDQILININNPSAIRVRSQVIVWSMYSMIDDELQRPDRQHQIRDKYIDNFRWHRELEGL